jgi:hypothetical protein
MEFLAPWNDPYGKVLIGKFVREHGKGLYMVTLQIAGTPDVTVDAMRKLGNGPNWGSVVWNNIRLKASGDTAEKWQEDYINSKAANGVLFTLATISRKITEIVDAEPEQEVEEFPPHPLMDNHKGRFLTTKEVFSTSWRVIHRVLQGLRDFALWASLVPPEERWVKVSPPFPPMDNLKQTHKHIIQGGNENE